MVREFCNFLFFPLILTSVCSSPTGSTLKSCSNDCDKAVCDLLSQKNITAAMIGPLGAVNNSCTSPQGSVKGFPPILVAAVVLSCAGVCSTIIGAVLNRICRLNGLTGIVLFVGDLIHATSAFLIVGYLFGHALDAFASIYGTEAIITLKVMTISMGIFWLSDAATMLASSVIPH